MPVVDLFCIKFVVLEAEDVLSNQVKAQGSALDTMCQVSQELMSVGLFVVIQNAQPATTKLLLVKVQGTRLLSQGTAFRSVLGRAETTRLL